MRIPNTHKMDAAHKIAVLEEFETLVEDFASAYFGWPFTADRFTLLRSDLQEILATVGWIFASTSPVMGSKSHRITFEEFANNADWLMAVQPGQYVNGVVNAAVRVLKSAAAQTIGEIELSSSIAA